MKHITKCENTRAFLLSLTLIIASVISIIFAGRILDLKWLFQLLFLCLATASIQILIKYVLTVYEYSTEENFLYVYKSTGKRKAMACKLNLCEITEILEKINPQVFKAETRETINLTRNFKCTSAYKFRISTYGGDFTILAEISDEYADFLNTQIENYRKGIA